MFKKTNAQKSHGFTLVEMLVVAPLIVLVIAIIIGFLLGLVSDTVVTNTRTQTVYDVQTALTQIERDTFLATQFMSSYTPHSPQGKDDSVAPFNSNSGDIIINQYGTTTDPTDTTRTIVYYANQPQPCGGQYQINPPFYVKAIYFLKSDGNGTSSLYRRMIVPLNNTNLNNGDTTCATPWQRSSCTVQNLSDPRCQAKDIKLLSGITAFTPTYYNKANPSVVVADPTTADSVRVTISVTKGVAGKSIAQTSTITSSRTNTADPTPTPVGTPNISLLNPSSDTYNNPVLTTFQWSASNASQYSYTYKITGVNGGAWSTPVVTTGTSVGVTTPYSNVTITFSVTATNDNGTSTSQYVYTTPVWTIPSLQNNWVNYNYGYANIGYTKTNAGIILIKGLIQRGTGSPTAGETIATLPVGCRPAESYIFLAGGVSAPDRLDIKTNGIIMYETGAAGFMSLEGIAYIPAGSSYVWTPFTFQNSWVNYDTTPGPTGFAAGAYTIDSIGRVFTKGLIKNGATGDGTPISSLPAGYRPPDYLHVATTSNNVFDLTGFEAGGNMTTKGINLNAYRSIQHNYYATGMATWNNLSLQNSWSFYGGGYAYPQYTKGSDGIVKLKGLIHNGATASGTVIANLPAGYRPAAISLQSSACAAAYCRFDVQPNGDILTRDNVNSLWSSLDTITFLAEQ